MSRLVVGILLLFMVTPTHADFEKLVGYKCDTKNNAVILTYIGAGGKAGEEMIRNKDPRQWDPWSLIARRDDGSISERKTVRGQCKLKDGLHEIRIGPFVFNENIQGACGAAISAWAEVWLGSRLLLQRHDFEVYCLGGHPVTTEIVVKSGGREIVIKNVPIEEFGR